ncbi:MAG: FAD binding domain-containing protein [Chloroflexi bacterium]|nr:FAD binding domain-containing protein [Chloroflexota bacterium]
MKFFDHYHLPMTVNEALELLAQYDGRARVVAGGTDLLVDAQAEYYAGERPHYDALVDVTRIAGANQIHKQDGACPEQSEWIVIGCGVTHTQIVESRLIRKRATALAEACAVIGGPQVRNVATLCGNIAHALPAADGTVALMAMDAEVEVSSYQLSVVSNQSSVVSNQSSVVSNQSSVVSNQWYALSTLFKGPGKSAVDSTRELITAIRFRPLGAGEGSAFARVMRPQGVALPILGMAVRVETRDRRLEHVAISAGPVAPIPFRAKRTEGFLRGKILDDTVLQQAAQILVNEAQPRTSAHRATKEYRFELLPTLLKQTLRAAMERAVV